MYNKDRDCHYNTRNGTFCRRHMDRGFLLYKKDSDSAARRAMAPRIWTSRCRLQLSRFDATSARTFMIIPIHELSYST